MDFMELIKTRRSIRRFKQTLIGRDILVQLLEAARSAPFSANIQPLEYILIDKAPAAADLFELLEWAGYVQPARNPAPDQRPVAYIIVLANTSITKHKTGVAAASAIENILLAAWSMGIGSCWLGSVNFKKVQQIFDVPQGYLIDSVIALGYPDETPIMEDAGSTKSIKYYLDENDRLHVPKLKLADIAHANKYGERL